MPCPPLSREIRKLAMRGKDSLPPPRMSVGWILFSRFTRFVGMHMRQAVPDYHAISHKVVFLFFLPVSHQQGNIIWQARSFAALPYFMYDGTDDSRQHCLRMRALLLRMEKQRSRNEARTQRPVPGQKRGSAHANAKLNSVGTCDSCASSSFSTSQYFWRISTALLYTSSFWSSWSFSNCWDPSLSSINAK